MPKTVNNNAEKARDKLTKKIIDEYEAYLKEAHKKIDILEAMLEKYA